MAKLDLPKGYTPDFQNPRVKPVGDVELDYSSELLTPHLAVTLFDVAGIPKLLGTNKSLGVLSGTPVRQIGNSGYEYDFGGANSFEVSNTAADDDPVFAPSGAFTIFAKVKRTSAGASFGAVLTSPMFNNNSGWLFTLNASNKIQFFTNDGSFSSIESTNTIPLDVEVFVIATYDGSNKKIYIGNAEEAAGSGAIGYNTPDQDARIGAYSGTQFQGTMSMLGIVHKEWTSAEVSSFVRNPYQILKPKAAPVYWTVGGAGGISLTAETGSYSYTGTANNLLLSSILGADTEQYTYSGTDAGLFAGNNLEAETGAYVYSGTDAALTFASAGDFTLSADSGGYVYSGTNADLLISAKLDAETTQYTYSGTAATLTRNFNLTADTVQYTYSGTSVDFSYNRVLGANGGVYTYTGSSVSFSAVGDVWTDRVPITTIWTDK